MFADYKRLFPRFTWFGWRTQVLQLIKAENLWFGVLWTGTAFKTLQWSGNQAEKKCKCQQSIKGMCKIISSNWVDCLCHKIQLVLFLISFDHFYYQIAIRIEANISRRIPALTLLVSVYSALWSVSWPGCNWIRERLSLPLTGQLQ